MIGRALPAFSIGAMLLCGHIPALAQSQPGPAGKTALSGQNYRNAIARVLVGRYLFFEGDTPQISTLRPASGGLIGPGLEGCVRYHRKWFVLRNEKPFEWQTVEFLLRPSSSPGRVVVWIRDEQVSLRNVCFRYEEKDMRPFAELAKLGVALKTCREKKLAWCRPGEVTTRRSDSP